MRRTKASLIYKATGNLRAVQILLGHTNIENTVRYLGVDIDDAITLTEPGSFDCCTGLGAADVLATGHNEERTSADQSPMWRVDNRRRVGAKSFLDDLRCQMIFLNA
jgi:hypothetical protein